MLKQPDIASINPVARVLSYVPVGNVGNEGGVTQGLGDKASEFVNGQDYIAKVISKVGDSAYNVKVENGNLSGSLLRMDLGVAAKAGQILTLRYIEGNPLPTFLLQPNANLVNKIDISNAAHLISHYLKQAQDDGVSTRLQAGGVVSQAPANAEALAHDLKNAVNKSGLFYESHLRDLLQGKESLSSIRQEPQNQTNTAIAHLTSQQLAILENQRMTWRGEVWPGQLMDWDVYEKSQGEPESQSPSLSLASDDKPIFSEMTLHLPHLGKVSANIRLVDGRMRVSVLTEQAETLAVLKEKRQSLAEAITQNGQQLDALTVTHYD